MQIRKIILKIVRKAVILFLIGICVLMPLKATNISVKAENDKKRITINDSVFNIGKNKSVFIYGNNAIITNISDNSMILSCVNHNQTVDNTTSVDFTVNNAERTTNVLYSGESINIIGDIQNCTIVTDSKLILENNTVNALPNIMSVNASFHFMQKKQAEYELDLRENNTRESQNQGNEEKHDLDENNKSDSDETPGGGNMPGGDNLPGGIDDLPE